MSYLLKRAWAEVNLDNIGENLSHIKNIVGDKKVMAVVKADAYGHGFLEVARTFVEKGADYLGVACLDEAKQLRRHGVSIPILILGDTPCEYACDLVDFGIIPTVFNLDLPLAMSKYASSRSKGAKIHIKVDTGMMRLGFSFLDDNSKEDRNTLDSIIEMSKLYGIEIEGIFSHFACADDFEQQDVTNEQFERFISLIRQLEVQGVQIPVKHICNSAATILYPNMHLDMVRVGLILYGYYPSKFVKEKDSCFKPSMQLKARIVQVKPLKEGVGVSYGKTYVTKRKTMAATLPIGYADGYLRIFSNHSKVLINGSEAPIIGTVCMDQLVVDVTGIDNVKVGDVAILMGEDHGLKITVEELAKIANTINYEILCIVGKRIPRAYIKHGNILSVVNYLN